MADATTAFTFVMRQATWRKTEPSVGFTAACWSPLRRSLVWGAGGDGATAADIYKFDPDTDLTGALTGYLELMPIVPDGDPVGLKRFHEVVFTLNLTGVASQVSFDVTMGDVTERVASQNTIAATSFSDGLRELRVMVPRAAHLGSSLSIGISPTTNAQQPWKLRAISVVWEPVALRGYVR